MMWPGNFLQFVAINHTIYLICNKTHLSYICKASLQNGLYVAEIENA